MPTSRKRARGGDGAPPFWRSRARLKTAHRNNGKEHSRLASTAAINSLALIAHSRIAARDYSGAARTLSILLLRYRRFGKSTWHFPREAVAIAGAIGRHSSEPEGFLEYVVKDNSISTGASLVTGAKQVRAIALVEAALDHVAGGRMASAHDLLKMQGHLPVFDSSFLVHLFHGLIALAWAKEKTGNERDVLLAEAGLQLEKAAKIDPSEYICAHAAAAVEIQRANGSVAAGLAKYRAFATAEPANAFAQAALLKALRSLERPPRQEIVDAARALHAVDPIANDVLAVLSEAANWKWEVEPAVRQLEVAEVASAAVEHGGGNTKTWRTLADYLCKCDENERVAFWTGAGRDKWWPTHFFRLARINTDRMVDGLAHAKADVALLLDASIPYAVVVSPDRATNGTLC